MAVMTVRGSVKKEDLGFISPHEHIFIDIRNQFRPFDATTDRVRSEQKVQMSNLDALSRNPYAVKDNLVIDEADVAVDEITRFKKAGGKTLVDMTLPGIGRDVVFYRDLANLLDLNIVAGTGFYTADTHPEWVLKAPVDALARHMLKELKEGIDGTDIKAGVIGEIGTSEVIYPSERNCLLASAIAQKETGVAVEIHTFPWAEAAYEAAKIMVDEGVRPEKIAILHVDVQFNMDLIYRLLDLGVLLEFENWGKQYYIDKRYRSFAGGIFEQDIVRIYKLKELCQKGYAKQIIMANDVCLKVNLHKYGGWGYDHILRNIIPMMRDEGISEQDIVQITQINPADFIDVE